MSEVETAAQAAEGQGAPEAPESFSSASEAAAFLARHAAAKRKESQEAPAEAEQPEEVSGQPEQQQETEAEQQAPEPEAEEPPIAPPVSWSKEDKEHFATLPRSAQEIIARREQERDRDYLQGKNQTAAERKAIEADKRAAEQVRQQYESQIPIVLSAIQQAIGAEFPDIKTVEDEQRLAREDWPRYAQYLAKQRQLAQWQAEAENAHQRQKHEAETNWQKWREAQDQEVEKFLGSIPENERNALAKEAKAGLLEYGFTEEQISELYNGSVLRSAPLQKMMADAARYRIAKRNAAKPTAKPVPPVQKPGNAVKSPNRALETQIAALEAKDSLTLKEATALFNLKGQRRSAA